MRQSADAPSYREGASTPPVAELYRAALYAKQNRKLARIVSYGARSPLTINTLNILTPETKRFAACVFLPWSVWRLSVGVSSLDRRLP